jgi:death-on-curing protein
MIVWLEMPLAVAIHDRQIAEHGGSAGVRDEALLASALARPRQLQAYGDPRPDLADLAASLAYGIARNHPFVDGNKRTAAVCCETFVEMNAAAIEADDLDLYRQYLALAEGKLTERDFAEWLRERMSARPSASAHESPAGTYRQKRPARPPRKNRTRAVARVPGRR